MPNTNKGPTHFAFIDLGGAIVRFGVLKKDGLIASVVNNSYGIKNIEACFSLKKGRRVFGTKLGNVPWEICFDANYAEIETPSLEMKFWKWYAEINEAGNYILNYEEGDQQYLLSKSHAIAMILIHVRDLIEQQICSKNCPKEELLQISINATIVVPSFCNQVYRQIVLQAAKIAGFNRVELLNQSTAITMSYRHEFNENTGSDEPATNENVLVLAVGAQTTEFSIYRFATGRSPKLLATTGTVNFGGASFTARLVGHFLKKSIGLGLMRNVKSENSEQIRTRKLLAFDLWKECERAKLDLEGSNQTSVFIADDKTKGPETITIDEFEYICSAEFGRFSQMLAELLSKQNVSTVMLAGGSSRLQWFKRALEKMKLPHVWQSAITPEDAAIRGAALKSAHSFANQQSECPASLAQAFIPEYLFGTLRVEINGQLTMERILDKKSANPTRKLPFHETSILSNSAITYFLNGKKVHTHTTRHILESICCAFDENGLFTINIDNNVQKLNSIKTCPGLLSESDERLVIEWERSLKEKQDQQREKEQTKRAQQRAARIEELKRREEAAKEAERLKLQQEEKERIDKERAELERVRKQKEDEERFKQLQKEKEESERERERVELERKIELERLTKQKEDEERSQKDKERSRIAEAKQISNVSSTQTFSDDKVEVTLKWKESAQRVFITGTWNCDIWSEMQKIEDNLFLFFIDLAPGHYQYLFDVDNGIGTSRKIRLNKPYETYKAVDETFRVNYIDVKQPESEFEIINIDSPSISNETVFSASVLKTDEFIPPYPYAILPAIATNVDDQIGNKFEAEQEVQSINKDLSSRRSNDQDQIMKTLTNLSHQERFEFLESIHLDARKLIEKFNELQSEFNQGHLYYSSAIRKYGEERCQLYKEAGNQHYERLLNVVHRAEALEFLVRVTYYIYKVWNVIKRNGAYKYNKISSKPFYSNYSFTFANQLMTNLQLYNRAHSTSELIDAFELIRRKTEEEILSKLDKKKCGKEILELEELAKKTVPRNFLSTPIKSLKSITNELIVS